MLTETHGATPHASDVGVARLQAGTHLSHTPVVGTFACELRGGCCCCCCCCCCVDWASSHGQVHLLLLRLCLTSGFASWPTLSLAWAQGWRLKSSREGSAPRRLICSVSECSCGRSARVGRNICTGGGMGKRCINAALQSAPLLARAHRISQCLIIGQPLHPPVLNCRSGCNCRVASHLNPCHCPVLQASGRGGARCVRHTFQRSARRWELGCHDVCIHPS